MNSYRVPTVGVKVGAACFNIDVTVRDGKAIIGWWPKDAKPEDIEVPLAQLLSGELDCVVYKIPPAVAIKAVAMTISYHLRLQIGEFLQGVTQNAKDTNVI